MVNGKTIALTLLMLAIPNVLKEKSIRGDYISATKENSPLIVKVLNNLPNEIYNIGLGRDYFDNLDAYKNFISYNLKKITLMEKISSERAVIVVKGEMEKYMSECKAKGDEITSYKIMTCEYLDVLEQLNLKNNEEECRQKIAEGFYPMMKKLERIGNKNAECLKKEITQKLKDKKITPKNAL
jgi:hypothetical protein